MADTFPNPALLNALKLNDDGLIPVIAQDHANGTVLMMAWMNKLALAETITSGQMVYWSRSRNALWRKGETSGQTQRVIELRIDCDGDTLLAVVEQTGVACHTGRYNCFYRAIDTDGLREIEMVKIDPDKLYR